MSDVHVNAPLTNISVAWMQKQDAFIADEVFPNVPVDKQSDRYFIYLQDAWTRNDMQERAPSTQSAGSGYTLDNTPTYYARVYALHKDIDDQIRANSDVPLNPDRDATMYVSQQAMQKRDLVWAANYFTTSVWTGSTSGGDLTGVASAPTSAQFVYWNVAGSTPIEDITTQIVHVGEATGYRPNTLVLSPYVYNQLKNHAEFMDRIKYTQRGVMTPELLAAILDLDKVLIPWGIQNTAHEGQTMANSFIYGKNAFLCYSAPSAGLMQPTAGYTFSWTGYFGAAANGTRVKRFRIEEIESDRVEIEMAFDMKVVSATLGVFFSGAVQ
jgi:hypothetical protein